MRGRCLGWRRRRMPASFLLLPAICSRNSDKSHRHRRPRRETSPLASERPGGPVLPLGAASCGLAVNSLHSPCAPLLPVWGVDRARHTVPPPPGRLALPSPPHRHPLHARASGLAAAACTVVRPTTGSLLPSPSPNQYHCLSRCGTRASPSLLVLPLSSSRLHGRSKKEATCAVRRTPAVALPPACPW